MSDPAQPAFLFAPGAGAPSSHPWMQHWAQRLGTLGPVQTLDYPYMVEGGKRPDPLPKLIEAHRAALHRLRESQPGPVVLIGKSMGSRIGCHLSLSESVTALVCFGYPLCGAGDPTKLRDKVLRELSTPILFIQGTRDKLCPLELLQPLRSEMKTATELHLVEEGDHSLLVTRRWLKAHAETQDDVDQRVLKAIQQFLAGVALA
jgi:predicted alpha/beta-hydrolase family hydrolase